MRVHHRRRKRGHCGRRTLGVLRASVLQSHRMRIELLRCLWSGRMRIPRLCSRRTRNIPLRENVALSIERRLGPHRVAVFVQILRRCRRSARGGIAWEFEMDPLRRTRTSRRRTIRCSVNGWTIQRMCWMVFPVQRMIKWRIWGPYGARSLEHRTFRRQRANQ